jgi:hypothetical protein
VIPRHAGAAQESAGPIGGIGWVMPKFAGPAEMKAGPTGGAGEAEGVGRAGGAAALRRCRCALRRSALALRRLASRDGVGVVSGDGWGGARGVVASE